MCARCTHVLNAPRLYRIFVCTLWCCGHCRCHVAGHDLTTDSSDVNRTKDQQGILEQAQLSPVTWMRSEPSCATHDVTREKNACCAHNFILNVVSCFQTRGSEGHRYCLKAQHKKKTRLKIQSRSKRIVSFFGSPPKMLRRLNSQREV